MKTLNLDDLKRHKVFLRQETGPEPLEKWSVYRCLIGEIKKGRYTFILWDGKWYRVANSFANRVLEYVKTIEESSLALPTPTSHTKEADWLDEADASSADIALMDRKCVWCDNAGAQIEVCDLFTIQRHLIHAKRKIYKGMGYSHLFMQGRNSAVALIRDASFRDGARKKLAEIAKKFANKIPKTQPKPGQFKVVFAPMGKSKGNFAESLPFFSKLTLMFVTEELRSLGIEVFFKEIETPE